MDEIIEKLMSYIRDIRYTLLRQKLLDRKTYAADARCFLRLIEDRKRQATHHHESVLTEMWRRLARA